MQQFGQRGPNFVHLSVTMTGMIPPARSMARIVAGTLVIALVIGLAGCAMPYDPAAAREPYPRTLPRAETLDIQVFREGASAVVVNATTQSFQDFDLWLNQRFVRSIPALEAGRTIRIGLAGFIDENGEAFEPGGFLRTEPPMTIWLAEIQEAPEAPMIGLVTIGTTGSRGR